MTISSLDELERTQRRIAELERSIARAKRRLGDQPVSLNHLVNLHRRQIRELQAEIEEFLGTSDSLDSPIQLSYGTRDGASGVTPLSTLEKVLSRFRRSVTKVAEAVSRGTVREVGRPPTDLAKTVDFRVTGIGAGSTVLYLELPPQRTLGDGVAEESLAALADGAEWLESEEASPPNELGEEEVRRLVLRQLARLSPTERDEFEWIEISRQAEGQRKRTRFTSTTHRRANAYIERELTVESISIVGTLRAIDLDAGDFVLKDREGNRHGCNIPNDLVEEAMEYIQSQETVIVRGRRQEGARKLDVITIESTGEDE